MAEGSGIAGRKREKEGDEREGRERKGKKIKEGAEMINEAKEGTRIIVHEMYRLKGGKWKER